MSRNSHRERWRQSILQKIESMQARRGEFSDLAGWRAAIREAEFSEFERWWSIEVEEFGAMLEEASAALSSLPEVTPHRVGTVLSCRQASGAVREFAVVRFGRDLWTVRSLGRLDKGSLRRILIGGPLPTEVGGKPGQPFQNPLARPSDEQTRLIEQQVAKRIEQFLLWVASSVAVERWERGECPLGSSRRALDDT